jgi:hypothetical protein
MNPALDYARGRRALRPLLRSLTFVAELIAKPFRKAADFCDSPGPCNPRLGSVLQIAGVSRQSRHVCEGDTLVIWKHGRRGRSLGDLIETVNDLKRRAVGLRSLTEQIDTTTSGGRLISHAYSERWANSSVISFASEPKLHTVSG